MSIALYQPIRDEYSYISTDQKQVFTWAYQAATSRWTISSAPLSYEQSNNFLHIKNLHHLIAPHRMFEYLREL